MQHLKLHKMKTLIGMLAVMLIMTSLPIPSMYTSVTAATLSWGNAGDDDVSEAYSYNPFLSEDSNGVLYAMFKDSMGSELVIKRLMNNQWTDAGKAAVAAGSHHFATSGQHKALAVYVDYDHGNRVSVIEITPSGWDYVGTAGFSDHAVKAPRLVFHGDTPYAAYIDGRFGSKQAYVMKYNGTAWEEIGELPGAVDQIELDVDSAGSLYATYIDEGAGRSLSTMKHTGVSWEYVGNRGFTNEEVKTFDVAVTSANFPVAAYTDTDDQAVASLYDGSQWTIIGNKGFTGGGVLDLDIEVASNQDLYLLYKDTATKKANVLMKTGTNWETVGTKDFSNGEIYHLFLMIGSGNKPYIAYSSAASAFRVKVAALMTTYSVTYHANGADSGDVPINDNVYTEGESVTIEGNAYDLKKEDHFFDGWMLTPSPVVTDSVYYSWDELIVGQEDAHLYANWKLNPPSDKPTLEAVAGDGRAVLTWHAIDRASDYNIYVKSADTDYSYTWLDHTMELTYTAEELANDSVYYFVIEPANENGAGDQLSEAVKIIPLSAAQPNLPYVSIVGSGSYGTYVGKGDELSLTFITSLKLKQLPMVTIAGQSAVVTDNGNKRYTAAYTLDGSEDRGDVKFTIDVVSESGVAGEQVTATTDGSKLIYGSPPSSGIVVAPPSNEQRMIAEIMDQGGTSLFQAAIQRVTDANGKKRDEVTIAMKEAEAITNQLADAKKKTAKLILPDEKDEVYAAHVLITKDAAEKLHEQEIILEIDTKHVSVRIPEESLKERDDDVYFRIAPLRDSSKHQQVLTHAGANEAVIQAVGPDGISLLGSPVRIETNLQQMPVDLVLPIEWDDISDMEEQDIAIYIAHSDGSKQWLQGKLIEMEGTDRHGIAFTVTKFSTFSLVYGKQLQSYFIEKQVQASNHTAYMRGYDDGLFQPDKEVTRAEIAVILSRVLEVGDAEHGMAFTDVKHDHWARASIDQVSGAGLMNGYSDGTFMPQKPVTRAEMAIIMTRYAGQADADGRIKQPFNDIDAHWAESAIQKAQVVGIITGYDDGTFRPDQALTRAQAVIIINRLVDRGPLYGAEPRWEDVPSDHWAFPHIQEASIHHFDESRNNGEGEQSVEES